MPEEAVIDAPPAQNTPAPDPGPAPKGMDALMAGFVEEPRAPEPKPDAAPAKPDSNRPDPKPDNKSTAKPEPKPDDLWEKAPPKLKNHYFQLRRESEEQKAKYESRIKEHETQLKERGNGQVDPKVVDDYKKQVKEWQERAAAADYRQSPEYEKNFMGRLRAEYSDAVEEVKSVHVITGKNEDTGVSTTRPATKEDFDRVLSLRGAEQDEAVEKMFGRSGFRVMSRIHELMRLSRAADQAVAEHAKSADSRKAESEAKSAKELKEYESHFSTAKSELETRWPDYFKADEKDAEAAKALTNGYEHSQKLLNIILDSKNPAEDRAANVAVLLAKSAALDPTILKLNKALAKIKEMEAERSTKRKTDPGAGDERNGGAGAASGAEGMSGIDALKANWKAG